MQIVIDIPEDRYDEIHSLKFVMYGLKSEENRQLFYRLINAVQDGTVLPKHGRLIDADAFEKDNSELWGCDFIHPKYCDTLADIVSDAPTILEANKENI